MACNHIQGDNVPHFGCWVCGQCFAKLEQRPQRLGLVGQKIPADWDGKTLVGERQDVVWQAEIIKSTENTTLSQFIHVVARRFALRGGLDKNAAFEAALDMLIMQDEPFGSLDYDWSRMSAIDLADEDMSYWDHDGPAAN
jgi:hypothetical protein